MNKIISTALENYKKMSSQAQGRVKSAFKYHALIVLACVYIGITERPEKGVFYFILYVLFWILLIILGYLAVILGKVFKSEDLAAFIVAIIILGLFGLFLYWLGANWGR